MIEHEPTSGNAEQRRSPPASDARKSGCHRQGRGARRTATPRRNSSSSRKIVRLRLHDVADADQFRMRERFNLRVQIRRPQIDPTNHAGDEGMHDRRVRSSQRVSSIVCRTWTATQASMPAACITASASLGHEVAPKRAPWCHRSTRTPPDRIARSGRGHREPWLQSSLLTLRWGPSPERCQALALSLAPVRQ